MLGYRFGTAVLSGLCFAAACLAIINPARAYTLSTLYSFCSQAACEDGQYPAAGLIAGAAGNLYGTTNQFGEDGGGVVYKLAPNGDGTWQYSDIYNFCSQPPGCLDGRFPFSDLAIDRDGNLYGTASEGGAHVMGTVFKLIPNAGDPVLEVLHSFCSRELCEDGSTPMVGLTYAGAAAGQPYDGKAPLYGTTSAGANGRGLIFELRPTRHGSWRRSSILRFCTRNPKSRCRDGVNPAGTLVMDAAGDIFGTTIGGGKYQSGVVFKLSFDGTKWRETVLHDFCAEAECPDGKNPEAPLALDAAGNLFGTTYSGGSAASAGVVFEMSPVDGNWKFGVLHTFCEQSGCPDGANPNGVSVAADGTMLGTTYHGGNAQNAGVLFRMQGTMFTAVYTFCSKASCSDGANPSSILTPDANGDYFGATVLGGKRNGGTVFEITP